MKKRDELPEKDSGKNNRGGGRLHNRVKAKPADSIERLYGLKGQKLFHSGYELRNKNKHDISILESISK